MRSTRAVSLLRRGCVVGLAVVSLGARAPLARPSPATPDFSGKWAMVSTGISFDSPLGAEGVVVQNGATITFTPSAAPGRAVTYRLDAPRRRTRRRACAARLRRTWHRSGG